MDSRKKEQVERAYEKTRLQFSYDYRELLKEYGMKYTDVAKFLGITAAVVRRKVQSEDITISDMVTLAAALQGTVRILIILPRP